MKHLREYNKNFPKEIDHMEFNKRTTPKNFTIFSDKELNLIKSKVSDMRNTWECNELDEKFLILFIKEDRTEEDADYRDNMYEVELYSNDDEFFPIKLHSYPINRNRYFLADQIQELYNFIDRLKKFYYSDKFSIDLL